MIEAIVGIFSGIAASMGLGGGFVLMIYLLNFTEINQLVAQGINLLFFLPIAVVSIIIHSRNHLIEWRIIPLWCLAGSVGVLVGVLIGKYLETSFLNKLFGIFILFIGFKETFHRNKEKKYFKKTIDKSKKV